MVTHDELSAAISAQYPDLVHGVDYFVGHEVEGDVQVAPARIYQWGIPERYQEEVEYEGVDLEGNTHTYTDVVWKTKFNSKYPEPSDEDLIQWVKDNYDNYHAVKVPQVVTRFQARAALSQTEAVNEGYANLLEEVDELMTNPSVDIIARIAWKDALEFNRHSSVLNTIATDLGLSQQELDALFLQAKTIEI